MKPHRILKDFRGSQTGHDSHDFTSGSVTDLSDDLAAIVVKEGWAQPVEQSEAPQEAKSKGDAPRNKARKAAPENKSAA